MSKFGLVTLRYRVYKYNIYYLYIYNKLYIALCNYNIDYLYVNLLYCVNYNCNKDRIFTIIKKILYVFIVYVLCILSYVYYVYMCYESSLEKTEKLIGLFQEVKL